jgi:putative transposase
LPAQTTAARPQRSAPPLAGLVLDAVEMAIWTRGTQGAADLAGLVHHSDAGSQHTSIAFTDRLAAGVDPSVGSTGDACENSLAETTIGLFQTEAITRRDTWKTRDQVEYAVAEWVGWYHHRPPLSWCSAQVEGRVPLPTWEPPATSSEPEP